MMGGQHHRALRPRVSLYAYVSAAGEGEAMMEKEAEGQDNESHELKSASENESIKRQNAND